MEAFYILTEAMYQSLWQGIWVYVVLKLTLVTFQKLPSACRYNLLYFGQVLIFCLFCYNILSMADQMGQASEVGHRSISPAGAVAAPIANLSIRAAILSQAPLIGILYLLGLIIQSGLLIAGFVRIRTLSKEQETLPLIWYKKVNDWKTSLGIKGNITLVAGRRAGVFTAGFFKPIIYLPVTFFNDLTTEQAEAILLHELAHIKRHDYLFNLVQKAIEVVMFFNPVSWVLGAEIRKEREFCCDDLVLNYTADPEIYARALFILEQTRVEQVAIELAATGLKTNTLLYRIKRITNMNNYKSTVKPGLLALAGIVAVGLSVAWIVPQTDTVRVKKPKQEKLKDVPPPPPAPDAPEAPVPADFPLPLAPLAPEAPLAPAVPLVPLDTIPADSAAIRRYFNSPEWKKQMEEVKKNSEQIKKHFESPEWKQQMKDIQDKSAQMQKHFSSPEWKKHQELIAKNAEAMKKHFESPEWKKHQQLMEQNAEEIKKHFNSPEWKKQQQMIAQNAEAMKKHFESPEWKKQQKLIEQNAEEIKKHFDSPEWKKQMEEIKKNSEAIEKQFSSPEWKKKMQEIEANGKELEKKFNSSEWKKQMEELEKDLK